MLLSKKEKDLADVNLNNKKISCPKVNHMDTSTSLLETCLLSPSEMQSQSKQQT